MSDAKRIGIIIPAILERCRNMQLLHLLIQMKASDAERKAVIMAFHEGNHLTGQEVAMLLETYGLEHV